MKAVCVYQWLLPVTTLFFGFQYYQLTRCIQALRQNFRHNALISCQPKSPMGILWAYGHSTEEYRITMNTATKAPFTALETLVKSTRCLIDNIVQLNAPDDEIAELTSAINALNARLATLPKGRPMPHYDLTVAKTHTNYTLPYSPVCGPFNPIAPPVDMHYDATLQQVIGKVRCGLAYEGPQHCVHGAIIAAIYDQLLALASACLGQPSFTAYLHTDYKKPTPLFEELVFRAWIASVDGRKVIIKGHCTVNDDIVTETEGLFIQLQR
jgi:hypothetical protein